MLDRKIDGQLQVTAAVSLLESSRLLEWWPASNGFRSVPHDTFEYSWRHDVDPVFGRLICWINFSAGAELLAKGLCLVNDIEIRREQQVPRYPFGNISAWAAGFRLDPNVGGTTTVTHFGTLGFLLSSGKAAGASILQRLASRAKATAPQENLLIATYELLRSTIRNRDAHAYVPNVRDAHFDLVPDVFLPCINLLVSWIPGGPAEVSRWRREAGYRIASL